MYLIRTKMRPDYKQPHNIERDYSLNEALREREVIREHRRQKYEARTEIKFVLRRQMLR